jgi:hypothetical protein
MSQPRENSMRSCAPAGRRSRGQGMICAVTLLFLGGCAHLARQPAPALTGSYAGETTDGTRVTIALQQDQNAVTGHGTVGSDRISISALTSWAGPVAIAFPDGRVAHGHLALSPLGEKATLEVPGLELELARSAGVPLTATGPFSGSYQREAETAAWVRLVQNGDLIAGTGYLDGKPIAVAGKVIGPNQARGTLLFSDESRTTVTAVLSEGDRVLTVDGAGRPIKLRRR